MPARPQFGAAVVVVEGSALAGLTLTQLGDYAAMRAYSGADPARLPSSAPTILRVVDAPLGSEVPVTMTNWDFSFLRGLYAGDWNLFKAAQQYFAHNGQVNAPCVSTGSVLASQLFTPCDCSAPGRCRRPWGRWSSAASCWSAAASR